MSSRHRAEWPIYVMVIEGHVPNAFEALERALAPLRAGGIEQRLEPNQTLLG